ncbi:MAG: hypothetical protein GX589_06465 [Deltaproteobacteria bacterium]|nr:hypothetical protein [Deltaproteobacteria bacterium]
MISRTKISALMFSLVLLFTVNGCSTGWPHRYDTLAPRLSARGQGKVIVVSRDQRPHIMDGTKRPQHVGMVRGMYGDPWEVLTASGKPFGQDLSSAVCNAMLGRGYDCLPLISAHSDIKSEIDYLVSKYSPIRILYFTIGQWENDIYTKTILDYDLLMDVWSGRGRAMASVRVRGQDELPVTSFFNPAQNASIAAPQALERYLQLLLNNDKATAALNIVRDIDELGAKY